MVEYQGSPTPVEPGGLMHLEQAKELQMFVNSILNKCSKIHQLIGELESRYQDSRATKLL